jgi:zinc protease
MIMNRRLLHPVSLILLGAAMTMSAAAQVDRTVPPPPQKTPIVALPDIQKSTLSNGLRVWLVEHRELPIVALNLVFQSGSDRDPLEKPGLASMTADVLDEGTTTRDALQIADELESIGASLGVRSGTDGSFVTLNTLSKHLDKALDVFADVVTHPTFPESECTRLIEQRRTGLMQQRDRAATIASLALSRIIYGNGHPYGNDAGGTDTSLAVMRRGDLVAFYNEHYRPNDAVLVVVGDVTMDDLVDKLEQRLASWNAAAVPAALFPPIPPIERRTVYFIDKPGAPQTEVRIGYPAAARNTPDFFPLTVANRVLGGQFASRLNMNIREKRGFSYGVRSAFVFNKQPGPFVASGGVVATKTDSALIEFMYELNRTQAEGVTPQELDFVKKGLVGSFALTFETPSQIAGAMQNLVLYDLPDDYYGTYLQNIDAVKLDDVRSVSAKYFDTSHMAVVLVGDLSVMRAGVENLKLGTSVVCDVDGKPVTQ